MKPTIGHLVRRTWLSVIDRRLGERDLDLVHGILGPCEQQLWDRMQDVDKRHSLRVLDRFTSRLRDATRGECSAVLLHDIGKTISNLGTIGRVAATLSVLPTKRGRAYRHHERLGLEMMRSHGVGSDIIRNMEGGGRREFYMAFHEADNE